MLIFFLYLFIESIEISYCKILKSRAPCGSDFGNSSELVNFWVGWCTTPLWSGDKHNASADVKPWYLGYLRPKQWFPVDLGWSGRKWCSAHIGHFPINIILCVGPAVLSSWIICRLYTVLISVAPPMLKKCSGVLPGCSLGIQFRILSFWSSDGFCC